MIPPGLDLSNLQTGSVGDVCGWYLQSVAEAEKFVDAIVLGKPTVAYPQRNHYAAYDTEDSPDPANPLMSGLRSVGPFHIDRVLYQKNAAGKHALTDGQSISLSEPIGIMLSENRYVSISFNNCVELKQNSQYVLFLRKAGTHENKPQYATCNMELGRFNTDGTDPDRDINQYTWKGLLRDEIAATYGVTFVPVEFPPP